MNTNKEILLMLKSSGIGDGEPDLGAKLMSSFLNVILESGKLPAKIICMGTGIFLTTEGSPVKEILDTFINNGVEIMSCGTCLEYYGRTDKLIIGKPTNMKDAVNLMMNTPKVMAP